VVIVGGIVSATLFTLLLLPLLFPVFAEEARIQGDQPLTTE
jgi:cobalt-zinc-cadmium resistance protein CzcA